MRKGTVCFLIQNNKVLLALIEYGLDDQKWSGVGGFVEENETPEDAVVRETREEVDIEIDKNSLKRKTVRNYPNVELIIYTCDKWKGEISIIDPTIQKIQWFEFDQIPYHEMREDNREWLPEILSGS